MKVIVLFVVFLFSSSCSNTVYPYPAQEVDAQENDSSTLVDAIAIDADEEKDSSPICSISFNYTKAESSECNPLTHAQCRITGGDNWCYYVNNSDSWMCATAGSAGIGDPCSISNGCRPGLACYNCVCLEICARISPEISSCSSGTCNYFWKTLWGVCQQ